MQGNHAFRSGAANGCVLHISWSANSLGACTGRCGWLNMCWCALLAITGSPSTAHAALQPRTINSSVRAWMPLVKHGMHIAGREQHR